MPIITEITSYFYTAGDFWLGVSFSDVSPTPTKVISLRPVSLTVNGSYTTWLLDVPRIFKF